MLNFIYKMHVRKRDKLTGIERASEIVDFFCCDHQSWRVKMWIHAFPKIIAMEWNINNFIWNLNLVCQFHFSHWWPSYHLHPSSTFYKSTANVFKYMIVWAVSLNMFIWKQIFSLFSANIFIISHICFHSHKNRINGGYYRRDNSIADVIIQNKLNPNKWKVIHVKIYS